MILGKIISVFKYKDRILQKYWYFISWKLIDTCQLFTVNTLNKIVPWLWNSIQQVNMYIIVTHIFLNEFPFKSLLQILFSFL